MTRRLDPVPFAHGLDHPEGVAWGPDGAVYAGGEAGQLYRVTLAGDVTRFADTGGFVLGLCLDAEGAVYACDNARHAVLRATPDGTVTTYAAGLPERPMVNPNWPLFDAGGTLYVSDSGTWGRADGCLWAIAPDGTTRLLTEATRDFPNGMALRPDGEALVVVETHAQRVLRVPLADPDAVEEVVRLPARSLPDGVAFDAEGGLLIACYTPDVIYRLAPDGALDVLAEDWTRHTLASPTNVVFCGEDLRTLVIASLGRWHLSRATADVPGDPLQRPSLRGEVVS